MRASVAAKTTTPAAVIGAYRTVTQPLIDATALLDNIDTSTPAGRGVIALDALIHIDELTNESAAILLEIAGDNARTTAPVDEDALAAYASDRSSIVLLLPRFTAYATPAEVTLQDVVTQALADRVGFQFTSTTASVLASALRSLTPPLLFPQMQSFVVLGRFAEQKTAADAITSVQSQRDRALLAAYLTAAFGLLIVTGVAAAGLVIARSVAIPLARLTASTNHVSRQAERELVRVADDDAETSEPIQFDPVHVASDDEIAELAQAFERISRTAVQLVGRQATSRRNVAQMFGHVGRRSQNLVSRQISLIDSLEKQEHDSGRLADLYRLDHLTSRLRRNASSLVALSGATDQGAHFAPLAMVDVIQLALAEIEDYDRVDIDGPIDLMIAPGAVNDAVLVVAELLENATSFSPPHTRVTVSAQPNPARIIITDHGIGLSPERMARESARLAERERLDLAPTEVLGLFVVGRLARRHGLLVVLTETPGGGVTVIVDIETILVIGGPAAIEAPKALDPAPGTDEPVTDTPIPRIADMRIVDADGLLNLESIHRAKRAIESGRPWKAFELEPTRATVTDGSPDSPTWAMLDTTTLPMLVGAGTETTSGGTARRTIVAARPRTPIPVVPDEPPVVLASGLTKRVPGATIQPDQPVAAKPAAQPQDPDAVWDLVQQFESGVARAMTEAPPEPTEEGATR